MAQRLLIPAWEEVLKEFGHSSDPDERGRLSWLYGRVGHMKLGREETTYNAQGIWDGHGGCVLLEQHHHYLYAMVSEALDQ